jgi:hypothetical protein
MQHQKQRMDPEMHIEGIDMLKRCMKMRKRVSQRNFLKRIVLS